MSYTGSQSQSGNQAVVSVNATSTGGVITKGSTSTPTWTVIGEINNFDQSGTQNKTDDTTNLSSTAEEFIPTILTPGQFSGVMNRVSGDAGQVIVKLAFNQALLLSYKVQLAKNPNATPPQTTQGDALVFTGLVEEFAGFGSVTPAKKVATPFRFKVSGPIVETLGS